MSRGVGLGGGHNVSRCVQKRCVCAAGRLGARCAYTVDQLLIAARARARRERERLESVQWLRGQVYRYREREVKSYAGQSSRSCEPVAVEK